MSYTPFARWRNFTIENLKLMLKLYPDLLENRKRSDIADDIEAEFTGYKRTAYQFGCQMGLESRSELFKSNNYLYLFDDDGLKKYLGFWFKMYVCPNPYVNSTDAPICPFVEIANRVLSSPDHQISYNDFCVEAFGDGKSLDIFRNALIEWGKPLKVVGDIITVENDDVNDLKEIIDKVQDTLPMKDNKSVDEFYERFSENSFMKFYDIPSLDEFCEKGLSVSAEIDIEPIPDSLSVNELAAILSDMYQGSDSNGIRMFGLKYGKIIVANGYSCLDIVKAAGIKDSYYSEVNKGVNIYKSILKNEYGIRFINGFVASVNAKPVFKSGLKCDLSRNRIIFGAPGTGKSFQINEDRKKLLGEDNDVAYERVTFHPDYSYANFVGTYKPVMVKNTNSDIDPNVDFVVSILNSKDKTAQEKYDILFEQFKEESLAKLPILLGICSDETFKTKKKDGSETSDNNIVERNTGKAIRKYVNLIDSDDNNGGDIAYEYVPGPFMRVYVKALKNARSGNPKPYVLIIEEINRANVAAVFGDIFQLLDRGEDNISEYPIQTSEDIKRYLAKELGGKPENYSQIRIPDNMFIWATMNSADQGVFPMDTAFKRRWDFTYLGIDDNDKDIRGKYVVVGSKEQQRIEWNSLRKAINEFMASEKINEDKQLGPYFLSRNIVIPSDGSDEIDSKSFSDAFKNKVLMYLFDDAAKQKRGKLFEGSSLGQSRYSKICEAFDEQGIGIFNADIQNRVKVQDLKTNNLALDETGMVKTE